MLRALLGPRIVLAAVGLALALAFVNLATSVATALVTLWTARGQGDFTGQGTISVGGHILYLPQFLASLAAFLIVLVVAAYVLRRADLRDA